MRNDISYHTIKAYLLGQLPPEQASELEVLIATDPELAEEVEAHRHLLPALDRLKNQDLQTHFRKWNTELEEAKGGYQKPWWRWYHAVIGVFFLALLGTLWFFFKGDTGLNKTRAVSPSDSLQQRVVPPLPDSTEKLENPIEKRSQPLSPTKPKTQLAPKDSIRIAAVKQLSDKLIAGIYIPPAPGGSRGQNNVSGWETTLNRVDSLTSRQQFQAALSLLNATPQVPKKRLYARQASLYSKLGDHAAAISSYQEFKRLDGDVDKTNWELALYYLAAYPGYQQEFWQVMEELLKVSAPKYQAAARKLVADLAAAGVVR